MPEVEITLPERLDMKVTRLVEQGEFADREEAVRELLSAGVRAYQTHDGNSDREMDEPHDDMMGHDDEYVF